LDVPKSCNNCLKGKPISLTGDILCNINGIVRPDFYCKHYRPGRNMNFEIKPLTCSQCAYFKVSEKTDDALLGVCRLFTERKFSGEKKACSKIQMLSEHK
jgi:hypothetical protein